MNSHEAQARATLALFGVVLAATLILVGCAAPTTRGPESVPVPALELLHTGPLEIPAGCEPRDGTVYRTRFVVQAGGRAATAVSESGVGCVQDALRNWVSTFQYQPISAPVPTVIDWMAVSASRGG